MFAKNQSGWVIADIFAFGAIVRNNASNNSADFFPTHALETET